MLPMSVRLRRAREGRAQARKSDFNVGKRGKFIESIKEFLKTIGIEEVSQSALCKLSEQIAERLGVRVSHSVQLLEEEVFSCIVKEKQFNNLFMSIFCDILVKHGVISLC